MLPWKKLFIPVIICVGPLFRHWVSSMHTSRPWKSFLLLFWIFAFLPLLHFPVHNMLLLPISFYKRIWSLRQERIPGIIRFNMLISEMSIPAAKSWRDSPYFMDLVSKRNILLQFNGISNSLKMVVDWIDTHTHKISLNLTKGLLFQ